MNFRYVNYNTKLCLINVLNKKSTEQTQSSNSSSLPPKYSTINESEVSKFSQLANEWWAPNGPVKLLHSMNPLRVSYIREQLEKNNYKEVDDDSLTSLYPFRGLRMLDIGCGGGVLTEVCFNLTLKNLLFYYFI